MSAIQQLLAGGKNGGVVSPLDITSISDNPPPHSPATALVRLGSGGSIFGTGTFGPSWYSPQTGGIGSSFWCRMSKNSGSDPTSGLLSPTIYQLSSDREWTWQRTASGTTSANVTLQIASDSGMSNVVASATFNVTATVTNGVLFFPTNVQDVETGVDASAGYTFVGDGTVTDEGNSTSNFYGDWYGPDHPAGIGVGYWVRCNNVSGGPALTVGSYGTWLQIGAGGGRQYQWQRTTVGTSTGTVSFDFATDSGGSNIVYSSTNVTVTVTKN
jgi:hypothetical protein